MTSSDKGWSKITGQQHKSPWSLRRRDGAPGNAAILVRAVVYLKAPGWRQSACAAQRERAVARADPQADREPPIAMARGRAMRRSLINQRQSTHRERPSCVRFHIAVVAFFAFGSAAYAMGGGSNHPMPSEANLKGVICPRSGALSGRSQEFYREHRDRVSPKVAVGPRQGVGRLRRLVERQRRLTRWARPFRRQQTRARSPGRHEQTRHRHLRAHRTSLSRLRNGRRAGSVRPHEPNLKGGSCRASRTGHDWQFSHIARSNQ